jgi:hypothetical protein
MRGIDVGVTAAQESIYDTDSTPKESLVYHAAGNAERSDRGRAASTG